jgi:hypothetical protein
MLPEPPASCSSASPRLVFYGPLDDEVALVAFDDLVNPVELMAGPDERTAVGQPERPRTA